MAYKFFVIDVSKQRVLALKYGLANPCTSFIKFSCLSHLSRAMGINLGLTRNKCPDFVNNKKTFYYSKNFEN